MSTAEAIAAVTESLLQAIDGDDVQPLCLPVEQAVAGGGTSAVNVFLYQVVVNAAWRNQDLPRTPGGEIGRPLLPLNLYYLLTACDPEQTKAHASLGRAMLRLHDRPELAIDHVSGVAHRQDPVRVCPQPMSVDELSKLWSIFQATYRPSMAYEVGVVLMESEFASSAPLPVLRRGDTGRGWDSTTQRPASLAGVRYATARQPGARLGESVTLVGQSLRRAGGARLEFRHLVNGVVKMVLLAPGQVRHQEVRFDIPDDRTWPAGRYRVTLEHTLGGEERQHRVRSNAIPLAILPELVVPPGGLRVMPVGPGRLSLALRLRAPLVDGQAGSVLIGGVEVARFEVRQLRDDRARPAGVVAAGADTLEVDFASRAVRNLGGAFARLRLDGVDSLAHDPANPANAFAPSLLVQGFPE